MRIPAVGELDVTLDAIKDVMDTVSFPVFVLREDATYTYQNPAAAAALGYRLNEIAGCCLTDLLDAEPKWALEGFEQLRRIGHFSGPVLYRMKRGGLYRGDANVFMHSLIDGSRIAVSMVLPVSYGSGKSNVVQTVDAFDLTSEEVRLLQLISVGLSDGQIAKVLNIPLDNLERAVQVILKKMAVGSRTAAAVLALKATLVL